MYINDAEGWLSDWDFEDVATDDDGKVTTYAVFDASQNCLAEFDTERDAMSFIGNYPSVAAIGYAIRSERSDSPADRTYRPKTAFFAIETWDTDKCYNVHYNKKFLEDFAEFIDSDGHNITVRRDIPFTAKTRMQDYLTTSAYGHWILSKLTPQSYNTLINPEFF